jgi:hypothetical protein
VQEESSLLSEKFVSVRGTLFKFFKKATPNLCTPHRLLRRVNVIHVVLQALIITGLKFNMDSVYAFGTSTFVGSITGIWFLVQLSRNGRLKSAL